MKKGMVMGLALAAVIFFGGMAMADDIFVSYGSHVSTYSGFSYTRATVVSHPVYETRTTYVTTRSFPTYTYSRQTYVSYGPSYRSFVTYGPAYGTNVSYRSYSFDW